MLQSKFGNRWNIMGLWSKHFAYISAYCWYNLWPLPANRSQICVGITQTSVYFSYLQYWRQKLYFVEIVILDLVPVSLVHRSILYFQRPHQSRVSRSHKHWNQAVSERCCTGGFILEFQMNSWHFQLKGEKRQYLGAGDNDLFLPMCLGSICLVTKMNEEP